MGIFKMENKKQNDRNSIRSNNPHGRKQLNVYVHPQVIKNFRRLLAEYAVPQYGVVEHALQMGYFYLARVLRSDEKRKIIRSHLVNEHVLASNSKDNEEILRMGEGRYASELISLVKDVVSKARLAQRAMANARKTGNYRRFDIAKDPIFKSVLRLADWLCEHPLDETDRDTEDWI